MIFKNESPKPQAPSLKSHAPNLEFGIWNLVLEVGGEVMKK